MLFGYDQDVISGALPLHVPETRGRSLEDIQRMWAANEQVRPRPVALSD